MSHEIDNTTLQKLRLKLAESKIAGQFPEQGFPVPSSSSCIEYDVAMGLFRAFQTAFVNLIIKNPEQAADFLESTARVMPYLAILHGVIPGGGNAS
jgi:hypothetical protein